MNDNTINTVKDKEVDIKISFHHGLTDGRGAKSFLETLVNYYVDYDVQKKQADDAEEPESIFHEISKLHHEKASELSHEEYYDPCENKYDLNTGKMVKFDPTKNTKEQIESLVRSTPSIFAS